MLEYFGCDFNTDFYHILPHNERLGIKDALRSCPVVTVVRPGDCIATEKKLDLDRICEIAGNFRFDLFCRPSYPKVLVWGCGLLALDGHHRLNAAVEAGEGFVPVGLYPFR